MKILCLHGAYASAKAFRTQLEPFVALLEQNGEVGFKFVDGQFPVNPPAGFEDYFGPPPYYRNTDFDGVDGMAKVVDSIRATPDAESYEDTLRNVMETMETVQDPLVLNATFDHIKKLLDADPEIEGLLGYSEGATTAASYILHEAQQHEQNNTPRRIKVGIFFAGWPPVMFQDDALKTILADESDVVIDIPSCHIVGCTDPYLYGAMALYGVCDEDNATLFDHGKGHTVPRDATTISELVGSIRATIAKASA